MTEEKKKEYAVYAGLALVALLAFFTSGKQGGEVPSEGLLRNEPGKGTNVYLIDAVTPDKTFEGLEIEVKAREYTEEELEKLAAKVWPLAIEKMLGNNASTGKVTEDLNFFTSVSGYPFDFSFAVDARQFIDEEGKLQYAGPFDTDIFITLSYKSFSKDFGINVHGEPGIEIQDRVLKEHIIFSFQNKNGANDAMVLQPTGNYLKMPETPDGTTYYFSEEPKNPIWLLLGGAAIAGVYTGFRHDEKTKAESRKKRIVSQLPGMLQKMTMYLSSGMTLRNIWIFLADEAKKTKRSEEELYLEMTVSANELKSGISESLVYSRFGERTGTPETVRLAALLSQNLKTGGTSISDLLRDEASKAFTDRKQRAVKAGEEAGTKLLFPMMLLLGDMLAMIMIPAFMNI